mmetsp:Transcript_10714/g.32496  ORF Transcript_10714/g.32496 Transcript_10714/m.32496 type:complete len:409 (-) Transcript_10714:912-2138(-)
MGSDSSFESRPHVAVIECPGGTDKARDGHRADTKYLLRGLRAEGMDAEAFFYTDATFDEVLVRIASRSDAFVSRVDPGVYTECTMDRYYQFLLKLDELGVMAFNHPDDMVAMGSKKSLINLLGLPLSVNDTLVYSSWRDFKRYFPRTLERAIAAGGRVLKQNRGSKGEGVWWVQVYEEWEKTEGGNGDAEGSSDPEDGGDGEDNATKEVSAKEPSYSLSWPFGNRRVTDKTIIRAVEASDNREVVTTLGNFTQETCAQYLEDSGEIIDMEYLPRIREGEIRLVIAGRRVVYVVEKRPAHIERTGDGFSANLDAGAKHIWSGPEAWPQVVLPFYENLDEMLRRMGARNPPALWTADFIRTGTADDTHFVLSEVNANCVGFKAHPQMGRDLAAWVRHELERKKLKLKPKP